MLFLSLISPSFGPAPVLFASGSASCLHSVKFVLIVVQKILLSMSVSLSVLVTMVLKARKFVQKKAKQTQG